MLCTGDPQACGDALQNALAAGGTFYVCPGRYQSRLAGGFAPGNDAVTLIGAGEGAEPDSNTILDGLFADRVLTISPGSGVLSLEQLRIATGMAANGGGILLQSATLHMTECTVLGNITPGNGGGINVDSSSTLEMTRCTVFGNHATTLPNSSWGGGIWSAGTTTLTDCVIEGNTAALRARCWPHWLSAIGYWLLALR